MESGCLVMCRVITFLLSIDMDDTASQSSHKMCDSIQYLTPFYEL